MTWRWKSFLDQDSKDSNAMCYVILLFKYMPILIYIYILIALALDESIILDVVGSALA